MAQEPGLLARAKSLRRRMTDAERRLWSVLRDRRFQEAKFRRQAPIDYYVADFVSFEHRLVIEVDGGQHNERDVAQYDRARTEWLESQGFRVLRFWNNEVHEDLDAVAQVILDALRGNAPSP